MVIAERGLQSVSGWDDPNAPVETRPLLYPIRIPASEIVETGGPCPLGQGSSQLRISKERFQFLCD